MRNRNRTDSYNRSIIRRLSNLPMTLLNCYTTENQRKNKTKDEMKSEYIRCFKGFIIKLWELIYLKKIDCRFDAISSSKQVSVCWKKVKEIELKETT